jgi:hypothetical protein
MRVLGFTDWCWQGRGQALDLTTTGHVMPSLLSQVPVWDARKPMPFARLYPFRRDVSVREHPKKLHERSEEQLGVEGIRCVRVQQANYPHLAVIGATSNKVPMLLREGLMMGAPEALNRPVTRWKTQFLRSVLIYFGPPSRGRLIVAPKSSGT